MRSKLLEEVVERFCEMFQAGCGMRLLRWNAVHSQGGSTQSAREESGAL